MKAILHRYENKIVSDIDPDFGLNISIISHRYVSSNCVNNVYNNKNAYMSRLIVLP